MPRHANTFQNTTQSHLVHLLEALSHEEALRILCLRSLIHRSGMPLD